MSSFELPDYSPPVKVTLSKELNREQLLDFPAFKSWISTLKHNLSLQENASHSFHNAPYKLRSIEVQTADWFGGKKLGFVKLKAEVTNDKGEYLPGSVFLRGGSVAMLLTLQPDDVEDGSEVDKHVILTVQPRIPAGSLTFAEIPAGMLDDSGSLAGAAMSEIYEETGLKFTEKDLINMSELALASSPARPGSDERLESAMYPSAGGSDEFISVFLAEKKVKREDLDSWRGKLTGLRDHGEKITLDICRLEDLWKIGSRDSKAMAAWGLYSGLKKEGKI